MRNMKESIDQNEIEAALAPVSANKMAEREEKVRSQFWPKFRSFAKHIPFAEDVVAAFFCATDAKTPLKVRGTLLAALAYFIVPLDVVPDILAFIGMGDDIAVLTAAFTLVQNHITDEHREKASNALRDEKLKDEESLS